MRIAILHNAVPPDAPPEDQDTLVEVEVVAAALARLGHESWTVACTLDLAALRKELLRQRPDVIFNLVESLDGDDSLVYLPLGVLDALGVPYTGSSTASLLLTTDKLLAKERMRVARFPTPAWIQCVGNRRAGGFVSTAEPPIPRSWIIKGVSDQGSRGMGDDAVLRDVGQEDVMCQVLERAARTGRPCFAEEFIEGREFNLALLAGEKRGQSPFVRSTLRAVPANGDCPLFSPEPQPLPPAEIEFSAYPPDKPRIVGHRAKWQSDSFEYSHTPRRFDFPPEDGPLLDQLRHLAVLCSALFRLHGWSRVDFRVDAAGRPWILEVNANPCLSPDAGFAAALQQASIPFDEAIRRILEDVA
jgi:D-alanine-D-alanine ligase